VIDSLLPGGPLRLGLPLFPWCLLGCGLILAALWDLRWRRVPNWLSVALLASGLSVRWLTAGPLAAVWGLAGGATALLLLIFPFQRRWLGAGDVKLLTAIGCWLGPLLLVYAVLTSAVLGGVLSLLWLLGASPTLRREVSENLKVSILSRTMPEVSRPSAQSPPLAPAIALGTIAVVLLFARALIAS